MPHASASLYPPNIDKPTAYTHLLTSMTSLLQSQRNWVCNLANASSLMWSLYHSLPSPSNSVNWAGFYVLDPSDHRGLILGPFQGKVACQTIRFGRGVCGSVAERKTGVVVRDVREWEGHIACDGDSRSEVVVPILVEGRCVGVIDVDCAEVGGFDEVDQKGLETLAELLARSCDW